MSSRDLRLIFRFIRRSVTLTQDYNKYLGVMDLTINAKYSPQTVFLLHGAHVASLHQDEQSNHGNYGKKSRYTGSHQGAALYTPATIGSAQRAFWIAVLCGHHESRGQIVIRKLVAQLIEIVVVQGMCHLMF